MSGRGHHRKQRWFRRHAGDFGQFRRDAFTESLMNDQLAEEMLLQIIAIEEIIAARWPRSIGVRRRLARDLRASVAHIEGRTWTDRRIEALGSGWMGRP